VKNTVGNDGSSAAGFSVFGLDTSSKALGASVGTALGALPVGTPSYVGDCGEGGGSE
jgi:hypothetical protein